MTAPLFALLLLSASSDARPPEEVRASTAPARAAQGELGRAAAEDPRTVELKAGVRAALLEVRRARYALRKAEGARDPAVVEAAASRLAQAKAELKGLRLRLRELLSPEGGEKKGKKRKAEPSPASGAAAAGGRTSP